MIKETLAKNIERLRNQRNLSVKDLADLANTYPANVNRWLKAEAAPEYKTVETLAKIFGCDPLFLFQKNEEPADVVQVPRELWEALQEERKAMSGLKNYFAKALGIANPPADLVSTFGNPLTGCEHYGIDMVALSPAFPAGAVSLVNGGLRNLLSCLSPLNLLALAMGSK